ncbi:hypothetical protein [Streptomyces sp. NPDC052015]|uniref:hypothetical protein n=1 Tax=Streptomyces sp. NPDC052015 TaxID=3154755 RepID=UPI00343E8002
MILRSLAYVAAVAVIAVLTAWATTALPFSDPRLGQPAAIITGSAAALLVLTWQPTSRRRNR